MGADRDRPRMRHPELSPETIEERARAMLLHAED
jgi:hypothetical protein